MREITIPKKLEPIVKAFYAESPAAAKALLIQAAKAIYESDEENFLINPLKKQREIENKDLEEICAMMQSCKPQDMLEALFAAQIVVSHMLGMRKLAKSHIDDQRLGVKLLQLSTTALCHLQKKRSAGVQNITVSYNYSCCKSQQAELAVPLIPLAPVAIEE